MTLSDKQKKKIEEEEYRKVAAQNARRELKKGTTKAGEKKTGTASGVPQFVVCLVLLVLSFWLCGIKI